MQKAAKEKTFLLLAIMSALFVCAPAIASSIDVSTEKTRAELFLLEGQNRTGQQTFHSAKHVENYDPSWGVALESSVAPNSVGPTVSRPNWMNWRARQGGLLKGDNLAHPGAVDEVMVLGRQVDTAGFAGKEGYNVLGTKIWDVHVNDGWVMRGIMEGRTFLLASKPSISTLRQAPKILPDGSVVRDTTVFFRELKMLRDAGYIQKLLPDGRVVMVPGG